LEKYTEIKGIMDNAGQSREDLRSYYILLPSLFDERLLEENVSSLRKVYETFIDKKIDSH
jgi:hypothetical protein